MPYVDAALAFALSMLAIAIFVSNVIVFIVKPRKKAVMAAAVRHFAEKEMVNIFKREQERLKESSPRITEAALLESLTELQKNLLKEDKSLSPVVPRGDETNEPNSKNIRGQDIVSVSAEELVNLIKRSAFGKLLVAEIGDHADFVFDSFFQKYEGVRTLFRETTRGYATTVSMIAGVLIALALNINTFSMASVYIGDPQARTAALAQYEPLIKKSQEDLIANCTDNESDNFDACLLQGSVNLGTLKKQKEELAKMMPLGWSGTTAEEIGASIKKTFCEEFLFYFLGCVLTGLLAGLGTPFWFDAVRSITTFTSAVSGNSPGLSSFGQPAKDGTAKKPTL
jgi:hypothetical protein